MSDDNAHSSATLVIDRASPPSPSEVAPGPARPMLRLAVSSRTTGTASAIPAERPEAGSQTSAQMLALADVMDEWATALPRWDAQVSEPWFVFVERAYEAETALASRLRRLPTCRLSMCPIREQVDLTLAGISVSTE